MNAAPVLLLSLISDAGKRFVIPIYQRAYSWGSEQCDQLWEDVLSTGRHVAPEIDNGNNHFTGSVVWIQADTMAAAGLTPSLLIDGQQRITTVMLLLIALAEYAREHPDKALNFSYQEIIDRGYLVDKYKTDDSHFRLILSQGDSETFRGMLRHLEDPSIAMTGDSSRLTENLARFRGLVAGIADQNIIWNGLQRLEVVSISLALREDNPQLIFESMNSTGKDLSTADLVRNYVLLDLPLEEQNRVYRDHWRSIEQTLGSDSYNDNFDEFLRDWLTVITAPAAVVTKNIYQIFKRYTEENAYARNHQITELLDQIRRFAGYYARITAGKETNPKLKALFDRIHELHLSVVNPLLMCVFDHYKQDNNAITEPQLIILLHTIESYLFRRSVCDIPSNGLNKFFSSIIARVNKVRGEGGNVAEAVQTLLLAERNTPRRMPENQEFKQALLTRDSYSFRNSRYLLATLENSRHPKSSIDFAHGVFTIEHIMPQNALAHDEWKRMLGDNFDSAYAQYINNLGNLTLTAYNTELSDGSFQEKKARAVGGYDNMFLTISAELKDLDTWDAKAISARAERLANQAIEVWPMPILDERTIAQYLPEQKTTRNTQTFTFRTLCASGLLPVGGELTSSSPMYPARAVVTDDYLIKLLDSSEEFGSPSAAAIRVKEEAGAPRHSTNGWTFWAYQNIPLSQLRDRYLSEHGGVTSLNRRDARILFWEGFLSYCSERPEFVEAYGDPSGRTAITDSWMSFGLGISGYNASVALGMRDENLSVELLAVNVENYAKLLQHKTQINDMLGGSAGDIHWDNTDEPKKSRHIVVTRPADFDHDDWVALNTWIVEALIKVRAAARVLK